MDIDAIKRRLEAATPGPWSDFCESGDWWIQQCDAEGVPIGESICEASGMTAGDMIFITHAPGDIAALLAALNAAQKREEAMRRAIERYLEVESECEYVDGEPEVCPGVKEVGGPCVWCELRASLASEKPQ